MIQYQVSRTFYAFGDVCVCVMTYNSLCNMFHMRAIGEQRSPPTFATEQLQ